MTPSFSGSATSLVNGPLATCLIWEVEKDQINIKDELHKDKPKEMSSSPPFVRAARAQAAFLACYNHAGSGET